MSFLVRTLLGEDVVHPTNRALGSDDASQTEPHCEQPDRQRARARTLIARVQSCTVAQDRREALQELREFAELPLVMESSEVLCLCDVLQNYPEDGDAVESSLAVLSNITDVNSYPTALPSGTLSDKDKRAIRDSFLDKLIASVPLFLDHVKEGSFWSRFHAVQLLQRLQECDSSEVHKLLLSAQGIGILVDILGDNSHGGALRNEGLVLITAITATDTELQTLLAFDNAFEKLFAVVSEEGEIDGGVIVSDCLTITHNMLRGNRATQKLFCEMGCGRFLCSLMNAVSQRVRATMSSSGVGGHSREDEPVVLDVNFSPHTHVQNMILLMVVSIVGCVLRGARAHNDGAHAQDTLLRAGLLEPLASLALIGCAVDDAVVVEAMRALGVLLENSSTAIQKFMQLNVVTLFPNGSGYRVREWTAARAALHVLLGVKDRVLQPSVAQVFDTLLSTSACEDSVAALLLEQFIPSSSIALAPASCKEILVSECGLLMVITLLGASVDRDSNAKYYAALLLDRLLLVPAVPKRLLAQTGVVAHSIIHSAAVSKGHALTAGSLTSPLTGNVFIMFVEYMISCLSGRGEMDLNTLSACFRLLIRWVLCSSSAVNDFLHDVRYYNVFLQRAAHDEGPVHIRFWSAVLCAAVCVAVGSSTAADETETQVSSNDERTDQGAEKVSPAPKVLPPSMNREQLLERFFNTVGMPPIFDNLLFDVKASSPMWVDPPKNAFLRSAPALYDEGLKNMILQVIGKFKDICPVLETASCVHLDAPMHDIVPRLLPLPTVPPTDENAVVAAEGQSSLLGTNPCLVSAVVKETRSFPQVEMCEVEKLTDVCESSLRKEYDAKIDQLVKHNTELERELLRLEERVRLDANQRDEEEEHHVLVQSLNMLEEQLRTALMRNSSCGSGGGTSTESAMMVRELQTMKEERDQLLVLVAQLFEEANTPHSPGRPSIMAAAAQVLWRHNKLFPSFGSSIPTVSEDSMAPTVGNVCDIKHFLPSNRQGDEVIGAPNSVSTLSAAVAQIGHPLCEGSAPVPSGDCIGLEAGISDHPSVDGTMTHQHHGSFLLGANDRTVSSCASRDPLASLEINSHCDPTVLGGVLAVGSVAEPLVHPQALTVNPFAQMSGTSNECDDLC
uniref:Vesicle tethering protein Uso1/P115-like head domain-containing protein n=1 Tax=Trypanosoma vivax (strain Y486) TaxID=1055687 RepID=G0U3I3_TRYVY|nr:conserved hypothetical protein, fragment [Trypanosoma vivax Y486]